MQIKELFVSQRRLRDVDQIQEMIVAIEEDRCLPRIDIWVDESGQFQVNDGHHRLVAYWLSGRRSLDRSEYLLIETESYRPRFGRVHHLILRCMKHGPIPAQNDG